MATQEVPMEMTFAIFPRDPSGLFTRFQQIGWSAFSGYRAQNDEQYHTPSSTMKPLAAGFLFITIVFMLLARATATTHRSKRRSALPLGT